MHTLATSTLAANSLAQQIVLSFEDFYKDKTKFYTQSAIDLEGIDFVKKNLDLIINNLILCKRINKGRMSQVICNARRAAFQLSVSCYVDLYSLYYELQKQLETLELEKNASELIATASFTDLKSSLKQGMELINKVVIANVASSFLERAKGLSIYYPYHQTIDPSYLKTQFALDSLWPTFLTQIND
jgi:hypothetical protein